MSEDIDDGFVLVPVPIREDATVRLHFPTNITKKEAEKVARVIVAYANVGEHLRVDGRG